MVVVATISSVAAVAVGYLVIMNIKLLLEWSLDKETWNTDTIDNEKTKEMRYRRSFISSHIISVITGIGMATLTNLHVEETVIFTTFDMLWTQIVAFIVDYVLTSEEGLKYLKENGRKDAFYNAFSSLSSREFIKYFLVIILMVCMTSFLMSKAEPIMKKAIDNKPKFIPKFVIMSVMGSFLGNLMFYSFAGPLRANWALTKEKNSELIDCMVALSSIIIGSLYLLQPSDNGNVLETSEGRLAIYILVAILSAIILMPKNKKKIDPKVGIIIYIIIATVVAAVISNTVKNKKFLFPFLLAGFGSPMLTMV